MWDGARTGVSELLPSTHPMVTSVWCVWTQVHTGVVSICSDQPVLERGVVFGFVFFGVGGLGMGSEGAAAHGLRVMFHCMSHLRTDQNLYLCTVSYVLGVIRTTEGLTG